MKLTLGQAAKEVGISKPSLSAAIKKGRVSAYKNDSGAYEIDPSELFRVYPPKTNTNGVGMGKSLPETNPRKATSSGVSHEALGLLLAERDRLIEEKEAAIKRLEKEKEDIRKDLEDQKEQSKRMTLLLEDKRAGGDSKQDLKIQALEATLERLDKQNSSIYKELQEQKNRGFLGFFRRKSE